MATGDIFLYSSLLQAESDKESEPYEVFTRREGTNCIVSSRSFYKEIKMKDSWLDLLLGRSWEGRVREAQREAFQSAYEYVMGQERLDYKVNKLK